tara:strand:+ start:187 stop:420 length:234 start_codon:yes stop_codon:yes gene_type:complete
MMNVKSIFSTFNEWVGGLVDTLVSFVALGVLVQLIFGAGVFGVDVVGNLTALISSFGDGGFAGFLALCVLVGIFNKK